MSFRKLFATFSDKHLEDLWLELNRRIESGIGQAGASIVWRPGAPSSGCAYATWQEAYDAAVALCGVVLIQIDNSLAPCVPPAGTFDLMGRIGLAAAFVSAQPELLFVQLQEGTVIKNLYGISGPMTLLGNHTATPALVFDLPAPPLRVFGLQDGAQLRNEGSVAMCVVSTGQFLAVGANRDAAIGPAVGGNPVFDVQPGAVLVANCHERAILYDNWVQGSIGGTLAYQTDATTENGAGGTLPAIPAFLGTVTLGLFTRQALVAPSGGTTAGRPAYPLYTEAMVGASYFDTDVGRPVWWDGAAWVDPCGGGGGGLIAVDTPAQLTAVAGPFTRGQWAWVEYVRSYFRYEPSYGASVSDGIEILDTSVGGNTRWLREPTPDLVSVQQAAWYVDPANGSDTNDGATAGTALQTVAEWFRRTRGYFWDVCDLNLLADVTGEWAGDRLVYAVENVAPSDSPLFTVRGQRTALDSGTVTSANAQVPSTNTPPRVVAAGYSWTGKEGTYCVSSAGKAWWILRDEGANTARTSGFADSTFGYPTGVPLAGETFTRYAPLYVPGTIAIRARGYSRVFYQDVWVNDYRSDYGDNYWLDAIIFCRIDSAFNGGKGVYALASHWHYGMSWYEGRSTLLNCSFRGNYVANGATVEYSDCVCQDGQVEVRGLGYLTGTTGLGAFQTVAANAVEVRFGGTLIVGAPLYGTTTAVGLKVRADSSVVSRVLTAPTMDFFITGTVADYQIPSGSPAIPPLVAGAVVPAAAPAVTWAQWAAAPFNRRLVDYNNAASIVQTA